MYLKIKRKMLSLHNRDAILDANDQVVFRASTKFVTIHDTTTIEDAHGKVVASIKRRPISLHNLYTIELADGPTFHMKEEIFHLKDIIDIEELGWQLRGENILNFDFDIFDNRGAEIAHSDRKLLTLHDEYGIDVANDADAAPVVAIMIVLQHIQQARTESAEDSLWDMAHKR